MCGFSALVNCGDPTVLDRMVALQHHRGPDDGGVQSIHTPSGLWVGLGSRRLSIIDLSPAGHMPMWNEDRTLCLAYNGEVYNFRELRRSLESLGHQFRSSTDTEVVLRMYEEYGVDAVNQFEGMFAFVLYDAREDRLVIARDGFGIKPCYYFHQGDAFACASELKSLLCVPEIEVRISPEALNQYLTFLWVPEPATLIEGIRKLPAGHFGILKDGRLSLHQYWDTQFPRAGTPVKHSLAKATEIVRERLRASVVEQMVSDVPVGAFLSGGLDSSSIVAFMAEAHSQPIHTYCITFPKHARVGENTLDDPRIAQEVANHFGCRHEEIVLEPDVADLLPKAVWHMDEPVADPAILNTYVLCQAASQSSTVLLSGVGGDELFGGYRKYVAHAWAEAYRCLPAVLRNRLVEPAIASLPVMRGSRFKGLVRLMQKMGRSASLPARDRFLMNSTYLDEGDRTDLYSEEMGRQTRHLNSWETHLGHFENVADSDFLHQMLYLDLKMFLPSLNLNYNDKMSMASSVEVRVPFLNRQLFEVTAHQVLPEWKTHGFWRPTTKHILREAMRGMLPDSVFRQPKAGFFAPVDGWLAGDLKQMVDDLLCEENVRRRGLFRPEQVRRMIDEHRSSRRNWSMQIWQLLTLEIWMQTFCDTRHSEQAVSMTV